jgi:FkbM family methyltransferase
MVTSLKSILKSTPLYPPYFAWRYGVDPTQLSQDDARWAQLYASLLRPDQLVFDIGANVGARSKVFQHLGCRVVAVEPQRQCVRALKRSFGESITIIRAAISDLTGTSSLHLTGYHEIATMSPSWMDASTKSGRFRHVVWDRTETVRTVTLDALVREYGMPSFIKIDVEGHEEAVIRGLSRPVPALSFETHPEHSAATLACIDRLDDLGKYRFSLSIEDTAQLGDWCDSRKIRESILQNDRRGDVYAVLHR